MKKFLIIFPVVCFASFTVASTAIVSTPAMLLCWFIRFWWFDLLTLMSFSFCGDEFVVSWLTWLFSALKKGNKSVLYEKKWAIGCVSIIIKKKSHSIITKICFFFFFFARLKNPSKMYYLLISVVFTIAGALLVVVVVGVVWIEEVVDNALLVGGVVVGLRGGDFLLK